MPQRTRQATLAAIDDRIYRSFRSALHEYQVVARVILALTRAQHWWATASLAALLADRHRPRPPEPAVVLKDLDRPRPSHASA